MEQHRRRHNPYFISYTPPKISLTEGTLLPSSTSPPLSPFARPPTPGGGPLSSHPTTPIDRANGWFPPTDWVAERQTPPKSSTESATSSSIGPRSDSKNPPRQPLAPSTANPQRRDSMSVRKLLSLSSLRKSFTNSRSSLALPTPPPSVDNTPEHKESQAYTSQGTKRSSSPSSIHSIGQAPPQLRKRKSSLFAFRRKSGLFMFDNVDNPENDDNDLHQRDEYRPSRPATAFPPSLPQVEGVTNGKWAEDDIFTNVGR